MRLALCEAAPGLLAHDLPGLRHAAAHLHRRIARALRRATFAEFVVRKKWRLCPFRAHEAAARLPQGACNVDDCDKEPHRDRKHAGAVRGDTQATGTS